MDPATIMAVAGIVFRIGKEVVPYIKTAEELAPYAERIGKLFSGEHYSQEEIDMLNKLINEQSAKIQAPLDSGEGAAV
jgi:hypothetical protein